MTPIAFKNALDTLRWSQRTVAEAIGVSQQTAWRYAIGERRVPDDVARWLETLVRHAAENPPPRRPSR